MLRTFLTAIAICAVQSLADVTIYVQNPWANDPTLADAHIMMQSGETGWYPGVEMQRDGAWLYYTFTSGAYGTPYSNQNFTITCYGIFDGSNYALGNGGKIPAGGGQIGVGSLFATDPTKDVVYILVDSPTSPITWTFEPPDSKVIMLLNPWPNNSPKVQLDGSDLIYQMIPHEEMLADQEYWGWYKYHYVGDVSGCRLRFTDFYESEEYLSEGFGTGGYFDFSETLKDRDTVWVHPSPYPRGAPLLTSEYPNVSGYSPYRVLTAKVRDFAVDGETFVEFGTFDGARPVPGIVQETLGPDGKPVESTPIPAGAQGIQPGDIATWFVGDDIDTCIEIVLYKTVDGKWEYDSDDYGGFQPIDGFNLYDEWRGDEDAQDGDPTDLHNFHFSMELHANFVYYAGAHQEFIFRGDDDVWIFINKKLAIDLGNVHDAWWPANRPFATAQVVLDDAAATLGLLDGEMYQLDIFYMERQPGGSNFYMNTTLDLSSAERLFVVTDTLSRAPVVVKHNIKVLKRSSENEECGVNMLTDKVEDAVVEFHLKGPSITDSMFLVQGTTYFGGVTASGNRSVLIDTANLDGLSYGLYTVSFVDLSDPSLSGRVIFHVGGTRQLTISANVPDGSHFFGDTTVKLSTNASPEDAQDIEVYYKVGGVNDGPASLSDTRYQTGSTGIPVGGSASDDTVYLYAISKETEKYLADTAVFVYIRDIIPVTIQSSLPSGSDFVSNTTVRLSATPSSDEIKIYYKLGRQGDGPATASDILYDGSDITLASYSTTADTICVFAMSPGTEDYKAASATFIYIRDWSSPGIYVSPESGTTFGESLEIELSTDPGATLYYTIDGPEPTASGTDYGESATFSVGSGPGDTFVVRVLATGVDFVDARAEFTYTRAYLSDVIITPGSQSFEDAFQVTLAPFDTSDALVPGYSIHYIVIAGDDNDTVPDRNSRAYSLGSSISVSSTCTIKARAYANESSARPSLNTSVAHYTKLVGIAGGSYQDRDADGTIDFAVITLDRSVTTPPDSIKLRNPFIAGDERLFSGDEIQVIGANELHIVFSSPFGWAEKTGFTSDTLGRAFGDAFSARHFTISDGVAPVIVSASYVSGDARPDGTYESDHLRVTFSEEVGAISGTEPFLFGGVSPGGSYRATMTETSRSGSTVEFLVTELMGTEYPGDGDTIWINTSPAGLRDNGGNLQDNPENRRILMDVETRPYILNIAATGPANPRIDDTPARVLSGTAYSLEQPVTIRLGFIVTVIPAAPLDGVALAEARVMILDAVGNVVASLDAIRSSYSDDDCVQISRDTNTGGLLCFWNGKNSRGRFVGSGSYLMMIRVRDDSENKKTLLERRMIGVFD